MKRQELNISDLEGWMAEVEILYAADSTRKLTITAKGNFKVYHNGEIVWQGMQPYSAIEKYNEI